MQTISQNNKESDVEMKLQRKHFQEVLLIDLNNKKNHDI